MASNSDEDKVISRLPMPSRNPLPLSSAQETQVRDLYYSRVRGYCAAEIKSFADCALGRTFTAPFKCRKENQLMNKCMLSYATPEEQDAAREEWFALRLQRQIEREKKEERRKEQEKFHREWWGLPPNERESKEGLEIIKKAERVGGFPRRDEGQPSKDRHR
ncbi:hypothetical protein HI914_00334 [Erysiphe necator]|uniref:COX assembly mitochondrial protein n=1 Tax=Uncinula necator TaxID=52586 RepID=A0A0B1P507_UNCNE|nr:hypothetical protein HI914_00334 [Erysiphe necator]KHJ33762.1 putative cmc1 domain-containig protein [Erysiphe necator]